MKADAVAEESQEFSVFCPDTRCDGGRWKTPFVWVPPYGDEEGEWIPRDGGESLICRHCGETATVVAR